MVVQCEHAYRHVNYTGQLIACIHEDKSVTPLVACRNVLFVTLIVKSFHIHSCWFNPDE